MTVHPVTRQHKVISLFIKAGILIFSFFYIAGKLKGAGVPALESARKGDGIWFLLPAFLLMFINWGLEALKWRILIAPLEQIGFLPALRSVFAGVTVSIFMPNRVGEFAGRIFFLQRAGKIEATLKNMVGSLLQLLITLLAGVTVMCCHIRWSEELIHASAIPLLAILAFVIFALITGVIMLNRFRDKLSVRLQQYLQALFAIPPRVLAVVFLLSLVRYSVFMFQYYLVLLAFGTDPGFLTAIQLIALTFLVTSVIPSFALTEVVTRGAVAASLFALIKQDAGGVVAASLAVWIINLAIPALIGSAFISQLKFFKK